MRRPRPESGMVLLQQTTHPNRGATMREMLTSAWAHIQGFLFPMLREEVGPLTPQHERLVAVLDVARIEAFVQM